MDNGFMANAAALRQLIDTTPIIDNHAHPLLKKSHLEKNPLLSIATEAHGDALSSSRTSLAHIRAVKQLSKQLGCEETWEAVEQAIGQQREASYEDWAQQCLSGIECVLVDDGLDDENAVEPYKFFDLFTPSASKRIVRIEQVAATLIEDACTVQSSSELAFEAVLSSFRHIVNQAIEDKEVVGFKSVICYRTGLDITRHPNKKEAMEAFSDIFQQRKAANATKFTRLNHRPLNEYIVHALAQLIRDCSAGHKKPIQFHTGLGDNDLTLTRSSPAHLQDFAREYPTVPIILLHSGYPFDRETGYMAAMYANVYADIGEVFPFVSRDGQESILRHVLELCPWEKIIWSTDGHWFPETFFLAVTQMREVFHTVLCELVQRHDLSWEQAAKIVEDVLFNTSNKIYDLGLVMKRNPSSNKRDLDKGKVAGFESQHLLKLLRTADKPSYIRLYWVDYTATLRMRAILSRRAASILQNNKPLTITVAKASLSQLQNDFVVADVGASGEYVLHADLSSLRQGPKDGHMTVMVDFKERDGVDASLCPRLMLQQAVHRAHKQNLQIMVGFEIELMFVRPVDSGDYKILGGNGHSWSSARAMDHEVVDNVIETAIQRLDEAGVYVELVHAESAKGQYELVLPKAAPVEAVDTLIFAREVIATCASAHNYKMTLHPKPIPEQCGTAAHAHISVISSNDSTSTLYESFYAGILSHLRAICAFTYSNMVSYDRVQDGTWAGGTWVTWGTQNRETPLRKIEDSHWEIKCVDGLANPYLAMSAILRAGINGVAKGRELSWGDCAKDPALLSNTERERLGICMKLPVSLDEALESLVDDLEMTKLLGEGVVQNYVAVKKAELEMLQAMDDNSRRKWIIERY